MCSIKKASGNFEVEMLPLESSAPGEGDVNLGRMSIDKTFSGDLIGTSKGEMLTAMTPVKGSAGYVAIEQFIATLVGKAGTFVLQHFGIMHGDFSRLELEVVPGSGLGQLEGLSGKMEIKNKEGLHSYEFDYKLIT